MSTPVGLVTDSSSQLASSLAPEVVVVPVAIVVDGEVADETSLDTDLFYDRLAAGAAVTTAAPGPGRFTLAYEELAARGATVVLSLHLDERVSGVVAAARLGAADASVPVRVVDTHQTSFGVAACVLEARRALAAGRDATDVERLVHELGPSVRNVFVAPGAPGGRVPDTGLAVLSFAEGAAVWVGAATSEDEALAVMVAHVTGEPGPWRAAIGHAGHGAAAAAATLSERLVEVAEVVEVLRYRLGPSVGVHTGALSFGAVFWPAERVREQS